MRKFPSLENDNFFNMSWEAQSMDPLFELDSVKLNAHCLELYDDAKGDRLPEEQKKKVFQAGLTHLRDQLRTNNKESDKKKSLDERFYNKYFKATVEMLNLTREEFFSTRNEKSNKNGKS